LTKAAEHDALRRDPFPHAGVDEGFDVLGLFVFWAQRGEFVRVVPGCGAGVEVLFGVGEDPVQPGEFAVLLELVGDV
jgi:hypothetical protein